LRKTTTKGKKGIGLGLLGRKGEKKAITIPLLLKKARKKGRLLSFSTEEGMFLKRGPIPSSISQRGRGQWLLD